MRSVAILLGISLLVACHKVDPVTKHDGPCPHPLVVAGPSAGLHADLDRLLRSFVTEGEVDYRCLKEHEAVLDGYLTTLAGADPGSLDSPGRLALWINAYNAFTLKLILRRYPDLDSIRDIPDRWELRDWDVGGRRLSLDAIEHEILRKDFREPRIHFAIVCASLSCPDLRPEVYVGARIDEQLDAAARGFLADESKGLSTAGGDVAISKLFDWFEEDFDAGGGVVAFLRRYAPEAKAGTLAGDVSPDFLTYDWTLNGR